MTRDNNQLGQFDLTNIPAAARGVPQIVVTFEVDANGILNVAAEDKGTGKSKKITISSDKNRLSKKEIEALVEEAEQYAEQDKKARERVDARNKLEAYLYSMKNTAEDSLAGKIADSDKETVVAAVSGALDWLEENNDADTEDFVDRLKEVEDICQPIVAAVYASGDDEDFEDLQDHDEL
eukprot:gene14673-20708_t